MPAPGRNSERKKAPKKSLDVTSPSGGLQGVTSPLKTPKEKKGTVLTSATGKCTWQTGDCSGPLCDALHRCNADENNRKQIREDNPLMPAVLQMVQREQLESALESDITIFWGSDGRREAVSGIYKHDKENEPASLPGVYAKMVRHARRVVKAVQTASAINVEVSNWISRQKLLSSQVEQPEETHDQRFDRLQEFWGQYHESHSRKPVLPPARSSPPRAGSPARPGTRGSAGSRGRRSGAADEDDEEPAMAADCNSGANLWQAQGYFPKSKRLPSKTIKPATLTLANKGRARDPQAWKQRAAGSTCNQGRWNWSEGQAATASASSSSPMQKTSTRWFDRAEKQFMDSISQPSGEEEWKSLYNRMSDPKQLGLSNFLTPQHLKASTTAGFPSKSCSLPSLASSSSIATAGRCSTALNKTFQAQARSTAPTALSRAQASTRHARSSTFQTRRSKSSGYLGSTDGFGDADGDEDCGESSWKDVKEPWKLRQEMYQDPWKAHGQDAAPMTAHATPTGKYLQVCSESGKLPALLPFTTGHSTKLIARGKDLADSDLQAITTMLCGIRVQHVDLGGCVLLTEKSLTPFMQALLGMPACEYLKHLSLQGCPGVGTATLATTAKLLSDPDVGAQRLMHLDLSGINIGVKWQLRLCKAIHAHPSLTSVRMAETRLGSFIDAGRCVVEICSSKTIKHLDLGWNNFDADVFKRLGEQIVEAATLTSLTLASSSATTDGSADPESILIRQRHREDCSPIVHFIETLSRSKTLTKLDMSLNRIDFRVGLVIEDALALNTVLKELDVSSNPLGSLGMRSLLRLLSQDESGLMIFNCADCCQGTAGPTAKDFVFSATNPSGRYKLDLSMPEDRALLRMLYKSCERFQLHPEAAFTEMACTPAYAHPVRDSSGYYDVPLSGIFKATLNLEKLKEGAMKDVDEWDFGYFLHRIGQSMRYAPSIKKVVPLMALWRRMHGHFQEQTAILDALSKDFLLTYAQVRQFCNSREITAKVLLHLLGCIEGGSGSRNLAFLLLPTPSDLTKVLIQTRNCVTFNVENPTGHYKLDLANHADHTVAEQLLLLDRWEAGIASRLNLIDMSQRGNCSYFRNEHFQGRPMKFVTSVADWHLPENDTFEFDYASGHRPQQSSVGLDDDTVTNMLTQFQESECSPLDRVQAIRAVAHRMYLTCMQVRKLIGVLRDPAARAELMIAIFFRIIDVQNEKVFRVRFENSQDVFDIQKRLGCATFFPYIQLEQGEFEFDFAYHDNRLAANTLLILASKEGTQNLKKYSFTFEDGTIDDMAYGVKQGWQTLNNVPKSGVFRLSYTCAPEDRKLETRKSNLVTFGRHTRKFGILPEPGVTEDPEIMWWASLSGVSDDVFEFLYFCVRMPDFKSFSKVFVLIDGPGGNGDISFKEFEEGIKKMKCKRFKSKDSNETDRLRGIFRFLDPSGEGTVSKGEFSILEQIWMEIRLSIENFVAFLVRMFGDDLEEAWEFLIKFGDKTNDSLSMKQWVTAVSESGYFGPVKPIFGYMDKNGNKKVTFEEFEALGNLVALEEPAAEEPAPAAKS